jgi:hypothetical protein
VATVGTVAIDPFPLGRLLYLYIGSADVAADLAFWNEALGADLVWRFHAFGADVAAVRLRPEAGDDGQGDRGPLVLLADHRPVPSCLPIFAVESVATMTPWLRETGWGPSTTRVEVPDGPCLVVKDRSGNEVGLLEQQRPTAMVDAYADAANTRAVRRR